MSEKNAAEIRHRRLAFKLFDKGKSPAEILARIPRSRPWLFKWKRRFTEQGWPALENSSTAPQRSPQQYPAATVKLVERIRRRLEKAVAGLIGPRAIREELRRHHRVNPLPSLATIKRWLRQRRVSQAPAPDPKPPYYPQPRPPARFVLQASDWIARYLPGGAKVFAFHTVDGRHYGLAQTLRTDKNTESACQHLLQSCARIGLPDFLQLDNDAAFTGLGRGPAIFGRFLRLALYLGIELIFLPPGEPKRNWLVERINGLWAASFWEKNHFTSHKDFLRKSSRFTDWYQTYAPPALGGLQVAQAVRQQPRCKLSRRQIRQVPKVLPLTAGRVHFIRRVNAQGEINIRKQNWKVSRRLAGQYVWATLDTGRQELNIYYRRSERARAKLLRRYVYQITEPVKKLRPEYRRHARRSEVLKIL